MPISLSNLSLAASRPRAELAKSLNEARTADRTTVFLSHSHSDARYALGMANLLNDQGMSSYIDWQDAAMPDIPDARTAETIRERIEAADLFMFLATPAAMASRWCAWEVGYADGVKAPAEIVVVQTRDSNGTYGNEYLDLYRSLDVGQTGELAIWAPGVPNRATLIKSL